MNIIILVFCVIWESAVLEDAIFQTITTDGIMQKDHYNSSSYKITKINGWQEIGGLVVGLEIFYDGQSDGSLVGSRTPIEQVTIDLDADEYITEITLRAAHSIDQVIFKTNKSNTFQIGTDTSGIPYNLNVASFILKDIAFGVDEYLDYIGFYWVPKCESVTLLATNVDAVPGKNLYGYCNDSSEKITRIKAWHNPGLEGGYESGNGLDIYYDGVSNGEHIDTTYTQEPLIFDLDPDEYIVEIAGNRGGIIDHFKLITNKGRIFRIGTRDDGSPFSLTLTNSYVKSLVYGFNYGVIAYIGGYFAIPIDVSGSQLGNKFVYTASSNFNMISTRCIDIMVPSCVGNLGTNPTCSHTNNTNTLEIYADTDHSLIVNSYLNLRYEVSSIFQVANPLPHFDSINIQPNLLGNLEIGASSSIYPVLSDIGGLSLSYEWSQTGGDGISINLTTASQIFPPNTLSPHNGLQLSLTITIADSGGWAPSRTILFDAITRPSITITSPLPHTIFLYSEVITLTTNTGDTTGMTIAYSYQTNSGPTTHLFTSTTSTAAIPGESLTPGDYEFEVILTVTGTGADFISTGSVQLSVKLGKVSGSQTGALNNEINFEFDQGMPNGHTILADCTNILTAGSILLLGTTYSCSMSGVHLTITADGSDATFTAGSIISIENVNVQSGTDTIMVSGIPYVEYSVSPTDYVNIWDVNESNSWVSSLQEGGSLTGTQISWTRISGPTLTLTNDMSTQTYPPQTLHLGEYILEVQYSFGNTAHGYSHIYPTQTLKITINTLTQLANRLFITSTYHNNPAIGCPDIFTTSTITNLGLGATCTYETDKYVIRLGSSGINLYKNEAINFLSSRVINSSVPMPYNQPNIAIIPPTDPVNVAESTTWTLILNDLENLVVDKILWTKNSGPEMTLTDNSTSQIYPSQILLPGDYSMTVAMNFTNAEWFTLSTSFTQEIRSMLGSVSKTGNKFEFSVSGTGMIIINSCSDLFQQITVDILGDNPLCQYSPGYLLYMPQSPIPFLMIYYSLNLFTLPLTQSLLISLHFRFSSMTQHLPVEMHIILV